MKSLMLTTGMGLLAVGLPAGAQGGVERFERQLQQIQEMTRQRINPDVPPEQRARIDYGGYVATNFLAIDDEQQDTHLLFQPDLIAYFRFNIDGAHEFFLRARATYRDFYQDDSFDARGDTAEAIVEQAYYRFDLGRFLAGRGKAMDNNFTVTAGRQFVYWANGLVLGQYLDGLAAEVTLGQFAVAVLGGVTVPQLTVDFDSSRRSFDDHTSRGFYGAMLSGQFGAHRPYIYGLMQRDYNDDDPLAAGGGVATEFDYDSWYLGGGANGALGNHLVYAVEVVYEGGRTLSNSFAIGPTGIPGPIDQKREDISAAAGDFRLDYVFGDPNRSRLSAELIAATGSPGRFASTSATFGGITPGHTDHAFNALGLVNTGLAFAPQVSNLLALRLGGSTFPLRGRRLQVGGDVFLLGKFHSRAPIDEPTSDDWFLGVEPQIYLNWQVTSDISLSLRYGVFFPGSAIEQDEHPRNFFFAGVTFSF
jgi:hypothetical protein